jgi:predicted transcriptional regulator
MNKPSTPSDLELKILQALWSGGPQTAREALESLRDGKARAYTTVLTTLQIMERKGFVSRTREGNADRWRARLREKNAVGGVWRKMLARVFGGRPSVAVQHLLEAEKVDAAELAEIERVIRAYKERQP